MTIAGGGDYAHADSYCGPGRHVGAENDGVGKSWQCVPDTGVTMPSAPLGTNSTAAAALQGASAILTIASTLASMLSATDTNTSLPGNSGCNAVKARDLNRQGLEAMQEGRYKRAELAFELAAKETGICGNFDDYSQNLKNANIAKAEQYIQEGFVLEQQGNRKAASDDYSLALYEAQSAGAADLAKQIASYNDRLVTAAGGPAAAANQGVSPTIRACDNLNGQIICR